MTHFLSNLSHEVITWPSNAEKIEIEHYFRTKGFPGVIGAIDGSHVKIDKPTNDPDSYLNRKHFFSIQFQVVCDHRRKIRDIFVGFPGSVHDSRVFRASPLSGSLPDKCGPFFIIGDSGYPCLPNLLTPFKDFGNLTRRQQHYNLTLSQNRYLVEHCIGILKQKFRQLYHVKLRSIPEITHFIRACCVVHNLCLDDDFPDEGADALNLTLQRNIEAVYEHERENEGNENRDDVTGIQRRRNVMNMLPL
ncbi:putative nuclease HARBI1 [Anoplophora glabripennis]|uniref:putative nuclease HARBI1 n=1 Tax=Anoplophora glabripennis TaxID=217634 RepID=UPI000C764C49|nr:putative nuclease HARBI1 [Anoplophora glabripennis]